MPELTGDADRQPSPQGVEDLNRIAVAARNGDKNALTQLVRALQDDIYRLALRMRWDPDDAADATQEVLIRVVTRIGTWRQQASVRTWAWRIAINHLRDRAPTSFEQAQLSFDAFAADLADGLAAPSPALGPDQQLLAEEVKLGCTLGMLQCLDRDHRLAYIFGDIFQFSSQQAAQITGTTPQAYRKRLSRARAKLRHFVGQHCGLINDSAACRCHLRITRAVEAGRVDPRAPRFASRDLLRAHVEAVDRLHDVAALMRSHPDYELPAFASEDLEQILRATRPLSAGH